MAGNANISLHPYYFTTLTSLLQLLPFLHILLRIIRTTTTTTKPPSDLHHVMTSPTPAFPRRRNERNTRSIIFFIGIYFLLAPPFIAAATIQGAVAVWSVVVVVVIVGTRMWGTATDDCGAWGLVRARFGGGEDSVDRLEEGPETGEAGANDSEREFGVGPNTCGCVVPYW